MLICGLKLTHDGGISVIEDGQLRVQIDSEKLANSARYSAGNLDSLLRALSHEGLNSRDIDFFAIDGWGNLTTLIGGMQQDIEVAGYDESVDGCEPIVGRRFAAGGLRYRSYTHVAGHIAAAYCTSPFAANREDALVLVWDGGSRPRLYQWSEGCRVTFLEELLPFSGSLYADFSVYFRQFREESIEDTWSKEPDVDRMANLGCAGKVMAFAAFGRLDERLLLDLNRCLEADFVSQERLLASLVRAGRAFDGDEADLFATFQEFVGRSLLRSLSDFLSRSGINEPNLCFAGGSALNVVWNSKIRDSGLFRDVWIPPFPNDSGSALGVGCLEMIARGREPALQWDVYSGPRLLSAPAGGAPCSVEQVAQILDTSGDPVIILNGRAELGPRALGNRSILAPCTNRNMLTHLNTIKDREFYRPVAPICLERRAPEIFDSGRPDPYMLFVHSVRPAWQDRIPAVVHADRSARLQTVSEDSNPTLAALLGAYEARTGIPVLCNTSANMKGCGFFPDVKSALEWGRVRFVWSHGMLYEVPNVAGSLFEVGDGLP